MNKEFTLFVVITLLLSSLSVSILLNDSTVSADSNSLYVWDDAPAGWYNDTKVRTIQEGIDNASAGDTVYVWNGTYNNTNIQVNKSVSIIGNTSANVTIDGENEGNASDDYLMRIDSNNITISGFAFKRPGRYYVPAVHVGCTAVFINNTNNLTMENCIFDGSVSYMNTGLATYSRGESYDDRVVCNVSVNNNTFLGGNGEWLMAVYFNIDGEGNVLENTTIRDNNITDSYNSMQIEGDWNNLTSCRNIDIINNTFTFSSDSDGVSSTYFESLFNVVVKKNKQAYYDFDGIQSLHFANNINDGCDFTCFYTSGILANSTIENNTFTNTTYSHCFDIEGMMGYLIIRNNTIDLNHEYYGLWLDYSYSYGNHSLIFENNTITGGETGIWSDIFKSSNWTFYVANNTFTNLSDSGIYFYGTVVDAHVVNNTITDAKNGITFTEMCHNSTLVEKNRFENCSSAGVYFDDNARFNYNISNNTFCNNTGAVYTASTTYNHTIEGNRIWYNKTTDITSPFRQTGFYIQSNDTTIKSNYIYSDNSGFTGLNISENGDNNTVYNNYFNGTISAVNDGVDNRFNITKTSGKNIIGGTYLGGNYWGGYDGVDLDGDFLGDTNIPYSNDYHPLVDVYSPIIFSPGTENNSEIPSINLVWNVTIEHIDAKTFNWTINVSNGQSNNSNDDSNGTKNITLSLDWDTEYKVWVNATDGENTTKRWFLFSTTELFSISNVTPINNSKNQLPTDWTVDILSNNGSFDWSIECSNGQSNSSSSDSNGTKIIDLPNLINTTMYTIWLNVTDGSESRNRTYYFTTYILDVYVWAGSSESWRNSYKVATISEAVTNISNGTIHVWNGTYIEDVVVNKTTDVIGNSSNGVNISTIEVRNQSIINLSGFSIIGDDVGINITNSSYVRVENVVINITGKSNMNAIQINSVNKTRAINLSVVSSDRNDNNNAFFVVSSSNVSIKDCTAENSSMEADAERNLSVENLNIKHADVCNFSSFVFLNVTNNIFTNCSVIRVSNSDKVDFSNNDISGNGYDLEIVDSNDSLIDDNNIDSTSLSIDNEYNVSIIDNTITDFTDNGVSINGTDEIIIERNILNDGGGYGISLANSSNITVGNNSVRNMNTGIWIGSSTNFTLFTNYIINNVYGLNVSASNHGLIYNNWFENDVTNACTCGVGASMRWNCTKHVGVNIADGPYIFGNYWHDYTGVDGDGDWIGNTAYHLPKCDGS